MTTKISYETERLILKSVDEKDAPLIYELLNSPKFLKFVGDRKVRSEAEALVYIKERMFPQFEKLGFSNFIVIRKSDGVKMGTCGLFKREGLSAVDVGFAYLPAFEGKGYGYEAANKMIALGFFEFNIALISAIVDPTNVPSNGLIKKLGMRFIKTLKLPNDETLLNYYEINKEEYAF